MFLQSLFNQADYLRRRELGADLEKIERSLSENLSTMLEKTTLPQGMASVVSLVLCYAGFRHIHWINTPIFRDILIHHVKSDYRIESGTAALLTDCVLRELRSVKNLTPSHVDNSDFEFLKYIFIIAATADNERSLVSDMGLGSEIIHKMKSTLKMVMTDPELCEKNPQVFLSDLDAQIYEIMLEVSKDIRRYPWSIHVDKLRYLMIGANDPISSLIVRYGCRWVFEVLLGIGSKSISSSNQILFRLQKNFMSSEPAVTEGDIQLLLEQLHDLDLIFPVDGSRNNDRNLKWELTNEAALLTADAFALTHVNAQKNPFGNFRELNRFYQKALLDTFGPGHVNGISDLLTATKGLPTDVIKSAIQYLSKHADPQTLTDIVLSVRSNSESTLFQKSMERALTDLGLGISE